jgi:hypothetical protein
MGEVNRIVDQLHRALNGDAWHGLPIMELLSGVNAEGARARPIPGRHTIWELVLHMSAWNDVVRRRTGGEVVKSLPPHEDWPPIRDFGESAWNKTVGDFEQVYRRMVKSISGFSDGRLDENVQGTSNSFYNMFHGIVQHNLYHAGQIAILKKKA